MPAVTNCGNRGVVAGMILICEAIALVCLQFEAMFFLIYSCPLYQTLPLIIITFYAMNCKPKHQTRIYSNSNGTTSVNVFP